MKIRFFILTLALALSAPAVWSCDDYISTPDKHTSARDTHRALGLASTTSTAQRKKIANLIMAGKLEEAERRLRALIQTAGH